MRYAFNVWHIAVNVLIQGSNIQIVDISILTLSSQYLQNFQLSLFNLL